ncbi:tetratricopeptide (TPR) repeat protein [Paenibacillus shirakamiensis]|uniref:Tetratricopeptide (TPR) repeat protein n=1 Tax=Paenibacillus shirakamiensis TaxID=1265935 RepID=A0ABS4JJM2_9BACL|nr:tetratricopeptide repeat protein [Paenibacillus shirakamiensis]MBP2001191.1 tetratricopeptide (TPR) repeat protein [Paenibacillus shirakamiensis]
MSYFFLFFVLNALIGNPFIAIFLLLIIVYFIDRRYVGVFPSITKPFKRMRTISALRQQLSMNPHDATAKRDLARLLLERKRYNEAYTLLEQMRSQSEQSAEYWDDLGQAALGLGRIDESENYILEAIRLNERVRYGQPYLRLAIAMKSKDPQKSIAYAEKFSGIHSSSCEAYYLLGHVYQSLDRKDEARQAFSECNAIYRGLPKYKKRHERKWALRSWFSRLRL